MKKIIFIILGLGFIFQNAKAQSVGINSSGSSPNTSAGLDIDFSNKGLLIPRVNITDLTNASPISSPATSLIVYNTNTTTGPGYFYWDGSKWVKVFDNNDGRPWVLEGNSGTTPGTDFLGTTDAQDLVIKTNNAERIRITSGGNVGIGTASPAELLHINGNIRGNQSGALRISTGNGYVDIGPKNSSWCHFYTDRGRYWFNKGLTVDGGLIGSYNEDLRLQTSGTTRIFVKNSNGYVGIGTTSPTSRLEIYGDQQNIEISNTSETDAGIIFNDAQATSSQYAKITYGCGDNDLNFLNASSTPRMVIESSGEVGIGTTNPSELFSVGSSSQFRVNSSGDITRIRNIPYHWPTSQGDANSMLVNDGSGNLSWVKSGWSAIAVIDLNNATSYTVSGLDGNTEINYKIILMGQQETNGGNSAFCILRPNGDNNSSNYSYSMDVWWRYIAGSGGGWSYDAYNASGIILYVADGNFNPNYLEIETILSAFSGNRRHAVTRYSLHGNTKDIVVNHSAGVWLNTTSNITSLEFVWSDPFTGKLIIYATH